MRAPCPSCGQSQVAPQGLGKAACAACGARYYSLVEAMGLFAAAGFNAGAVQQLLVEQSVQRHEDPLWEGRLSTIVVRGLEVHFSSTGQAIWMPADAAARLGAAQAAAAVPFAAAPPTPHDDPLASLGLASPSHGLPQENRASSGSSLDLDLDLRPRRPAPPPSPAAGAHPYGVNPHGANPYAGFPSGPGIGAPVSTPKSGPISGHDFAPPPPPPGEPVKITSESAFAARPKSNLSPTLWLLVKLAVVGGLVGGGYYGYREIRAELVWPRVALDWGYSVMLPQKPPPELRRRDFALASAKILSWHEKDTGLKLIVVYADVGLAHEDFVRDAAIEMFGERLQIEPPSTDGDLRFWQVEGVATDDRPAAVGRMWIDPNGRAFITIATAPDMRTLRASNVSEFVTSLEKGKAGASARDDG